MIGSLTEVRPWLQGFAWLSAIGGGAALCAHPRDATDTPKQQRAVTWMWLVVVLAVALTLRLIYLDRLPTGAYIDELFTLRNALLLRERPFDPFGWTPLVGPGWVETSNLYLTFDALVLRLAGVNYLSIKLFSVIPGVLACGFFYMVCTCLLSARAAVVTALLFATSHWHIRLSRYGWDASFLIMALTASLWLILRSRDHRPLSAFLSGVVAAIGLYAYISGRLVVVALLGILAARAIRSRARDDVERLAAFGAGFFITAAPLIGHFLGHPDTTWVRVRELSIFNASAPWHAIAVSAWWHALLFNVRGGMYARDNVPGLPMLEPLTGLLFLIGLWSLIVHWKDRLSMLLFTLLLATLAGGVFSISAEGAPYVYRVCAAVVPALLIAGMGLQSVLGAVAKRWPTADPRIERWIAEAVLAVAVPLNLYWYFGLEPRNVAAQQVMGAHYRVMAQSLRESTGPVYLVAPGVFDVAARAPAGDSTPAFDRLRPYELFGRDFLAMALTTFAGQYDPRLSLGENTNRSRVQLLRVQDLNVARSPPFVMLLAAVDSTNTVALREQYQRHPLAERILNGSDGKPLFLMLTVGAGSR